MTNYRRAHAPGASYFFTVNIARRGTTLLTDRIDNLRNVIPVGRAGPQFSGPLRPRRRRASS